MGNFSANSLGSENDPFTVRTPTVERSALSPTAETFTPGQVRVPKTAHGPVLTASGRISTARVESGKGGAVHGRVSSLHANSVPDLVAPQVAYVAQARPSHGTIGEPSPPHSLAHALGQMSLGPAPVPTHEGHYRFSSVSEGEFTSDEDAQRAIKITAVVGNESLGHLQMRFNVSPCKF